MNDLQKDFIRQTVAEIENLSARLQTENPSAEFLREIFRKLHSIKGTAQVFGLSKAAALAHSLEDALARNDSPDFLRAGFDALAQSLADENFVIPSHFNRQSQNFPASANLNDSDFPAEFTDRLSAAERAKLAELLKNERRVAVLEIGFGAADFVEDFKTFRCNLERQGVIVAALPCPKFSSEGKIGFQIIFAESSESDVILENLAARVVFQTEKKSVNLLAKAINKIVAHGANLAKKLGKNVRFDVKTNFADASPQLVRLIFETLLHLVRNAVDHGVEHSGTVEIAVESKENKLFVRVADDGRGLDAAKIRARAIEQNLLSPAANLTEAEIQNLIFAPAFSTAAEVSEISGRGVGLEAVKNQIEAVGGAISVASRAEKGVIFEAVLPEIL